VLDRVHLMGFTLHSIFTVNPGAVRKKAVNLSVHQDGGRPSTGIVEALEAEAIITEISMPCHNEQVYRRSFRSTNRYIKCSVIFKTLPNEHLPKWEKALRGLQL
jgi:hypothetical protein